MLLASLGLGLGSAGLVDLPLESWLAERRHGDAARWLSAVEKLPLLVAAGSAAWLLVLAVRPRLRSAAAGAAALLVSILGPLLVALLLKHAVGRARPWGGHGHLHFEPLAALDALASFPSAQSAMAAGMAVAMVRVSPRLGIPAVMLALTIGLGRLLAGAHWASDVVMAWGLGAALSLQLMKFLGPAGAERHP